MAFEGLQERLQGIFKKISGQGKLTEANMEEMLKEIRMALLEADVNFKVVKHFVNDVKEKALGQKVVSSLTASQMVVKIVKEELVELFGQETRPLNFASHGVSTILMCGLNGSGKTTTSAKLAKMLKKQGKNPLLVAADIYRPAARDQLITLAKSIDVPCFTIENESAENIVIKALEYAKVNAHGVVIIDTAGRLQVDEQLMQELVNITNITNINERLFLEGLFKSGNSVTSSQLTNKFYTTLNKILKNINGKDNKYKIFEKTAASKATLVLLFIIITLISIVTIPTLAYAGTAELFITIFITLFYIPFFLVIFKANMVKPLRIFMAIFIGLHSMIFFASLPITSILLTDREYLFGFIFGLVCLITLIKIYSIMPKRTPYGNELYGKLKGFKNFLETAEKEKLESMVMQNPTYFFDILQYTYVLGVSDKWIEKFETIAIQSPEWYGGSSTFNTHEFGRFMNSTMASAKTSMSSSPSSSGSGGSGGGSSGGGSGGGGGSSW